MDDLEAEEQWEGVVSLEVGPAVQRWHRPNYLSEESLKLSGVGLDADSEALELQAGRDPLLAKSR